MRNFWGPLSPLGLGIAAVVLLVDHAHKAWMLYVYDIGAKGVVRLTPFFDLVLVWKSRRQLWTAELSGASLAAGR